MKLASKVVFEDDQFKIVRFHFRGAESPFYYLYEKAHILGFTFWRKNPSWSTSRFTIEEMMQRIKKWDKEYSK